MNNKESFYLTTPIYYVNAAPHLGTAYSTVAADALARFMRITGKDTWFLTGLDEHGQKIAQTAEAEGKTPQAWVDEVAPQFKAAWEALDIHYDDFIRTTEPRHIRGVQKFFETLHDKGFIYKDVYEGYYCVSEETFFSDEQLAEFAEARAAEGLPSTQDDGSPLCPDCHRPLSFVQEENLFFKLSAFEQPLLDYYEANPDFIQPAIRRNEVISFVKSGLRDLSVSRASFDWGVPIPFAPGHVSYVWVDALINYITAVGYGSNDPADQEMFARRWPAQLHLIGKDIIRFHCVIWPAMLMAADLALPHKVFAHGFLLTKGEKMSKSKGNAMDPLALARTFSVDGYRYYFLSDVQFGSDGSVSLERMLQVYNADLANSWGNLCSRALNMMAKYLDATTPNLWEKTVKRLTQERGNPLAALVEGGLQSRYAAAFAREDYSAALAVVMELVDAANLYIEQSAPWKLAKAAAAEAEEARGRGEDPVEAEEKAKAPTQADHLAFVLYNVLESMRIAALLFAPVMPETSAEVWRRLGLDALFSVDDQAAACVWGGLPAGLATTVGTPLFMRLSEDDI
ncbi:MAG: methionine--tRNA ligase [Coriobacteriales bacterium]|jgi:methionyl-tRNA synthetase|nr:methionine--tRNA ligase [Coriobacteriales bacterium]